MKQKKQFTELSDEELKQVTGGVTVKNEALLALRAEITKDRVRASFSGTILD